MTHKTVQKARMKSLGMILGMGIIAGFFLYYLSDSMNCDKMPIDLSNATSEQSSKQFQQACYSIDSNVKIFSFVVPLMGLFFWFTMDRKVRKISKEIEESISKQGGKCFNCGKNIENDIEAILEPNNHCYCRRCDDLLFPVEGSK